MNEVTEAGLYFYYVSYKNTVKDETRPILACHVIHVDQAGKTGKLISIDLGLETYSVMSADFQQSLFPDMQVFSPPLYETGVNGGGSWYSIPKDNAYLGVKIDAAAGRIYTVEARNKDIEVSKQGIVKSDVAGRDLPVENLHFGVYDLEGKQLGKAVLDNDPVKLGLSDDPTSEANQIEIFPLPENEGAICRMLNNGTGMMWVADPGGALVKEMKFKPYSYKKQTVKKYNDLFSSPYSSMKDFERSPYWGEETSRVASFFEGLEPEQKEEAYYLSLETAEVIAFWDPKEKAVQFFSFHKN